MLKNIIADLYSGLPYRRNFKRFDPGTTFIDSEIMYRDNPRAWLDQGKFAILGVDINPGVIMGKIIPLAGTDRSITDLPPDLKNRTPIQPGKRSLPESLQACQDVTIILNQETYPDWRKTIDQENYRVGLVPIFSNTYDYQGEIKTLLADLYMNGILILGLSWIVDSLFACAQRKSGTQADTGLTSAGKNLIKILIENFRNPIALDLAHLSHESMRQVIKIFNQYSAKELRGKALIYSHGAVWDIFPGSYEVAAKGYGQQNIPREILQELAKINQKIPVLVQIMGWKGSFANREDWDKIDQAGFFEMQLQHAEEVMRYKVPVAFTSDWSFHPLYRSQFITPDGPLGLWTLRKFAEAQKNKAITDVFLDNQLRFLDRMFEFNPTNINI